MNQVVDESRIRLVPHRPKAPFNCFLLFLPETGCKSKICSKTGGFVRAPVTASQSKARPRRYVSKRSRHCNSSICKVRYFSTSLSCSASCDATAPLANCSCQSKIGVRSRSDRKTGGVRSTREKRNSHEQGTLNVCKDYRIHAFCSSFSAKLSGGRCHSTICKRSCSAKLSKRSKRLRKQQGFSLTTQFGLNKTELNCSNVLLATASLLPLENACCCQSSICVRALRDRKRSAQERAFAKLVPCLANRRLAAPSRCAVAAEALQLVDLLGPLGLLASGQQGPLRSLRNPTCSYDRYAIVRAASYKSKIGLRSLRDRNRKNRTGVATRRFTRLSTANKSPSCNTNTCASLATRRFAAAQPKVLQGRFLADQSKYIMGSQSLWKIVSSWQSHEIVATRAMQPAQLLAGGAQASAASKTKYKTVRPLLDLSRENLTTLCKHLRLPVYPDKSNKAVQYSRNRLREQILPAVKHFVNPKIEDALFKLAELLTQDFSVVSHLVNSGRRLKL